MSLEKIRSLEPRLFGGQITDQISAHESVRQFISMFGSYRELLVAVGGPIVFDRGAKFTCDERSPLSDKDGFLGLEILFGLGNGKYSIDQKISQYAGELPASFIPIGESSGGNLICVDLHGIVNLWNHESLLDEKTWRIARSVDEFLKRLEPDDSGTDKTSGIVETESYLDF